MERWGRMTRLEILPRFVIGQMRRATARESSRFIHLGCFELFRVINVLFGDTHSGGTCSHVSALEVRKREKGRSTLLYFFLKSRTRVENENVMMVHSSGEKLKKSWKSDSSSKEKLWRSSPPLPVFQLFGTILIGKATSFAYSCTTLIPRSTCERFSFHFFYFYTNLTLLLSLSLYVEGLYSI